MFEKIEGIEPPIFPAIPERVGGGIIPTANLSSPPYCVEGGDTRDSLYFKERTICYASKIIGGQRYLRPPALPPHAGTLSVGIPAS